MGWAGPRVRGPAITALVLASYLIVGQVAGAQFGNWAYSLLWDRRLLAFDAVKVPWEEDLPQMPRNVTQDWLFLD